jgi:MoaA/NifB/PqqE/SkfB family radical SAM enzyme
MMDLATFSNLVHQIKEADIRRVLVVGNGENTLHPDFITYISKLGEAARVLSLTSNWQHVNEDIIRSILEAPVRVLNISVDGGSKEEYERSRVGGKFENLIENLDQLIYLKSKYKNSLYVNIRLMLRPSNRNKEQQLLEFWSKYGDEASKQYIADWAGVDEDIYGLDCEQGKYPRCTMPFRQVEVLWNGNVPMCSYSHLQLGRPEGLLVGNINTSSLYDIWNSPLMKQYRLGHRNRDEKLIPMCNGCAGC